MRTLCTRKVPFFIITVIILLILLYNSAIMSDDNSEKISSEEFLVKSEVYQELDIKYILQWTSSKRVPFVYMGKKQQGFVERKCPYTNCIVTANRSFLKDYTQFDVIAFAGPEIISYSTKQLPPRRSPHQKYAFASIESADNYPVCSDMFNIFFNWTWTYKLDSDIRWGYITIRDKDNEIVGPNKEMNWIKLQDMDPVSDDFKQQLKTKTKAAAWFVSNCRSRSKRENVVEGLKQALKKYSLEVDVYGYCGNLKCPRDHEDDCDEIIKKSYYFYLSFENSFSEDYVTEKLVRALNNNAIPIVYGGANYTRFMPDGVYLDARKLNLEDLAAKMDELIKDPVKYSEYFKWKNHYTYHYKSASVKTDPYCLFCTNLNDEEMVEKTTIYKDFKKWWTPPGRC